MALALYGPVEGGVTLHAIEGLTWSLRVKSRRSCAKLNFASTQTIYIVWPNQAQNSRKKASKRTMATPRPFSRIAISRPPTATSTNTRRELRGPGIAAGAVLAGRAQAAGARNVPPLLELLANLSCADPHAVAAWLTNGAVYDWSPGSALAGLRAELNNRDEKVRWLRCGTLRVPARADAAVACARR